MSGEITVEDVLGAILSGVANGTSTLVPDMRRKLERVVRDAVQKRNKLAERLFHFDPVLGTSIEFSKGWNTLNSVGMVKTPTTNNLDGYLETGFAKYATYVESIMTQKDFNYFKRIGKKGLA